MHIALLSAEYPPQPGGVGDYTYWLGETLIRRGHDVVALTGVGGADALSDETSPPIRHLHVSMWGWRSWRAVQAALVDLRPDVLHIQYQTGAYSMHPAINLLPWRLRHLPARPAIVVTAHDVLLPYLFPKAGQLRDWVTRRLFADADAVVATNEADYARIESWGLGSWDPSAPSTRGLPPTNQQHLLMLIPIGVNVPVAPMPGYERMRWRAQHGIADDELLVAYFGLASRSKGLDVLVAALAQLPPRFRLIVVGGAARALEDCAFAEEVAALIARLGLGSRVIFTGQCPTSEVSAHLLAADLAVLPFTDGASFRRGSLLATLAHGVPTVTTHGPGIGDQGSGIRVQAVGSDSSGLQHTDCIAVPRLVDGEHVLLVPPGESAALAGEILRLAEDARLRERLSVAGRALAAQFSWDSIAACHERLYQNLVRGKVSD